MSNLSFFINKILLDNEISYEWSNKLKKEVESLTEKKFSHYQDLTNLAFVTIDGADAKDFDDALYCEKSDGGFLLYVAIADVAGYVEQNSILDKEAFIRGTSIYFPKKVVPMLHEKISNDYCSLLPHKNRNVLSAKIYTDKDGEVISYQFFEAVINSKQRLTYNEAEEIIHHNNHQDLDQSIKDNISNLSKLAKLQLKKRAQRGALEINSQEPILDINENEKVRKVTTPTRKHSHKLVEECMLLANICAADFLKNNYGFGLYRIHKEPDLARLESVKNFFKLNGIKHFNKCSELDVINKCLNHATNHDLENVMNIFVLQNLKRAEYSTKEVGHFGLQLERYTHFTSPIRRYPDLIVHRMIKNIINEQNIKFDSMQLDQDCEKLSFLEKRAEKVSRQVVQYLICCHLKSKIGSDIETQVTGITDFGLFAELENMFVSGLIHVSDLPGDRYYYNKESNILAGRRTGKKFRLGDKIKSKILNVIPEEGKITLKPLI